MKLYPFLNFHGKAFEVLEWINQIISSNTLQGIFFLIHAKMKVN